MKITENPFEKKVDWKKQLQKERDEALLTLLEVYLGSYDLELRMAIFNSNDKVRARSEFPSFLNWLRARKLNDAQKQYHELAEVYRARNQS